MSDDSRNHTCPQPADDSWNEYKRLVLAELHRINEGLVQQEATTTAGFRRVSRRISRLNKTVDQRVTMVEQEVLKIKTKAAAVGAVASVAVAVAVQILVKWLT